MDTGKKQIKQFDRKVKQLIRGQSYCKVGGIVWNSKDK